MTLNEQFIEKNLLANLDKAQKSCLVIIAGAEAETEDIGILLAYQIQLLEAVDNLRDRTANLQAISIREYKRIKDEASMIKTILEKKHSSLKTLEKFLKDERKKEEFYKKELEKLYTMTRRDTVLVFKGKDGVKQ